MFEATYILLPLKTVASGLSPKPTSSLTIASMLSKMDIVSAERLYIFRSNSFNLLPPLRLTVNSIC